MFRFHLFLIFCISWRCNLKEDFKILATRGPRWSLVINVGASKELMPILSHYQLWAQARAQVIFRVLSRNSGSYAQRCLLGFAVRLRVLKAYSCWLMDGFWFLQEHIHFFAWNTNSITSQLRSSSFVSYRKLKREGEYITLILGSHSLSFEMVPVGICFLCNLCTITPKVAWYDMTWVKLKQGYVSLKAQ